MQGLTKNTDVENIFIPKLGIEDPKMDPRLFTQ